MLCWEISLATLSLMVSQGGEVQWTVLEPRLEPVSLRYREQSRLSHNCASSLSRICIYAKIKASLSFLCTYFHAIFKKYYPSLEEKVRKTLSTKSLEPGLHYTVKSTEGVLCQQICMQVHTKHL